MVYLKLGPLFLLPFGIVSLIQGAVSIKRINSFLNAEELSKQAVRVLVLHIKINSSLKTPVLFLVVKIQYSKRM